MYQNFISRHFSNQSGIIKFLYLGPDSPRTSPRNETVKQCRHQMTVANSPVQWPSWTWCRKWWNHSWHSSRAGSRITLNQRCFAFIRPRTPLVYRYHVISRTQSHSAVFGCSLSGWMPDECLEQHPPRVVTFLTVEQLLYWSDWICTGRAAQIETKTKFRFGNTVPKQWTLSGFVQHTSANSIYNKQRLDGGHQYGEVIARLL